MLRLGFCSHYGRSCTYYCCSTDTKLYTICLALVSNVFVDQISARGSFSRCAPRICIFNFRTPLARRQLPLLLSHSSNHNSANFPSRERHPRWKCQTCARGIGSFLLSLWYFASRYRGGVEGFGLCSCIRSEGSRRMDGWKSCQKGQPDLSCLLVVTARVWLLCDSNHFSPVVTKINRWARTHEK